MFSTVRVLATMWKQRWSAARDEGATTIEYVILVLVGITVATAAAFIITQVVTRKDQDIDNQSGQ